MNTIQALPSTTEPLLVMGLMSGTSVDGVDACLAKLWMEDGQFRHEILAFYSEDMPTLLKEKLLQVMREKHIHLADFCALNVAVGELFAKTALGLLRKFKISASSIDCIGSHGQTIFHWPPTVEGLKQNQLGGTLQIGEPSIIAQKTGIDTIADFRPADMAVKGHGAPLVCFADTLLFSNPSIGRCIQNIGGIANVTVVPAHKQNHLPIIAFDTGPGNMMMDAAMKHFFNQSYDANGIIAAQGQLDESLFTHLMTHPYLHKAPPKTTGREDFGEHFFQELVLKFTDISANNWITTLAHFTAQSIVDAYAQWIFPNYDIQEAVLGGGGPKNAYLVKCLNERFAKSTNKPIKIVTHADFDIPDQAKEALAFAILAWANRLNIPNNIPSCTGAEKPVIMGKLLKANR